MIPKHALQLLEALPTFSTAIAELESALSGKGITGDAVEVAIGKDPALTANLLKLANSAAVGARREIADIRQAVSLIGLLRIRDLALTAAFSKALPRALLGYGMTIEGLWRHSVAVGTLTERVGMSLGVPAQNPLFVSGLLHDVGKLVAGTLLSTHETTLLMRLDQKRLTFVQAEREELGTDHAELAQLLGERWKLPQAVVLCGQLHHEPSNPEAKPFQVVVDLVHVADVMAHMLGLGADLGGLARAVNPESAARLALRRRDLELLASTHLEAVQRSLATLKLGES